MWRKLRRRGKKAVRRFGKRRNIKYAVLSGFVLLIVFSVIAASVIVPNISARQFLPSLPGAATITAVNGTADSLDVSFTGAAANGGTINMYQYSTDNGLTWQNRQDGGGGSASAPYNPLKITTISSNGSTLLQSGVTYQVRIRAVSDVGQGPPSNMLESSISSVPAGAPTIQTFDPELIIVPEEGLPYPGYVEEIKLTPDGSQYYVNGIYSLPEGESTKAVSRFNMDGTIDSSFNVDITSFYSFTVYGGIEVASSGKIYVGNIQVGANSRVVRLNTNGTRDTAFALGNLTGPTGCFILCPSYTYVIEEMSNGDLLLGGTLNGLDGNTRNGIVRVNSTGSIVSAFNAQLGSGSTVYDVEVLPDGSILVAGDFTIIGGQDTTSTRRVAKFSINPSTGVVTHDTSFAANVGNGAVYSIDVQGDGSVILGGTFTQVGGVTSSATSKIARVSSTGALDTSFTANANNDVKTVDVQPDGKILVGGLFTTIGGQTRNWLARLETSGGADVTFNPEVVFPSGSTFGMGDAFQMDNGNILVGGSFSRIAGEARTSNALLASNGGIQRGVFAGSQTISVSFAPPSNAAEAGITNYQYSTDGGTTWKARSPASTTSPMTFTTTSATGNTSLSNGTTYNVAIRAVSSLGGGDTSLVYPTVPYAAPGTASITLSRPAPTTIRLSWSEPAANGPAINSYDIQRATDSGFTTNVFTRNTNLYACISGACTFDDVGLTDGTTYHYRIRARTPVSVAAWSTGQSLQALSPAPAPLNPSGGEPVMRVGGPTATTSSIKVDPIKPPSSAGGAIVTGYEYTTNNGTNWCPFTTGQMYRVHEFTTTGNSTFTVVGGSLATEYLLVGGGAGGGWDVDFVVPPGGSGGGGVKEGTATTGTGSYTVTVGAGGTGRTSTGSTALQGNNGGSSSALGVSVGGGGAGGVEGIRGANGATGGGGSGAATSSAVRAPGTGVLGEGYPGGFGYVISSETARFGGGGGGAGGIGTDALFTFGSYIGGAGGNGKESSITGVPTYYGGGAGGVRPLSNAGGESPGGLGGGAAGIFGSSGNGNSGTNGLGGGASAAVGSGNTGGTGGSGRVVIRYPISLPDPTAYATGGDIVYDLFVGAETTKQSNATCTGQSDIANNTNYNFAIRAVTAWTTGGTGSNSRSKVMEIETRRATNGAATAVFDSFVSGSTLYGMHTIEGNGRSNQSTTFTPLENISASYLVVGGGGGAGTNGGGGGGGGGVLDGTQTFNNGTSYTMQGGGGGAIGAFAVRGTSGGASSISGSGMTTVTAQPGGGGASRDGGSAAATSNVGAGAGGGANAIAAYRSPNTPNLVPGGAAATGPPAGGSGGDGCNNAGADCGAPGGGGGGGGYSLIFGDAPAYSTVTPRRTGGVGASGVAKDITGTNVVYGAGGGGGSTNGAGYTTNFGGMGGGIFNEFKRYGLCDNTGKLITPTGAPIPGRGCGGAGDRTDGGTGSAIIRYTLTYNLVSNAETPASPPPIITGITPGNGQLSIAFTAPAGVTGITNYEYSLNNGSTWTAFSPADTTTPLVITGLTNGTSYNVKIRPVGPASVTASATVTAKPYTVPQQPSISSITPGNGQLTVQIAAPASSPTGDGGSAILGYKYSVNSTTNYVNATVDSNRKFVISNLNNGTTYTIRVIAFNAAGDSTASSGSTGTTVGPAPAPQNLAGTPGNQQVTLSWDAPASNGGSAITDYVVQYTSNGGVNWTTVGDGVSPNPPAPPGLVITGLTGGIGYNFRVAAVNSLGTGTYAVTQLIFPDAVPSAPSITSIERGVRSLIVYFDEPVYKNGVSNYEYKLDEGSWVALNPSDTTSPITVPNSASPLADNTEYDVTIRAVNSLGPGAASNTAAQTTGGVPSKPDAPTATTGGFRCNVSWVEPSQSNGFAVTDYVLEYSENDGSGWSSWVEIEAYDFAVDGLSYEDTGLLTTSTYKYRVSAVNDVGTSLVSDASNECVPTDGNTPPEAPALVTAIPNGPAVKFGWTEPDSELPIEHYIVEWSTDPSMSPIDGSYSTENDPDPDALSLTLGNATTGEFDPFTTYYVTVTAVAASVGTPSAPTLLNALPPVTVTQSEYTGESQSSISGAIDSLVVPSLTWDAINGVEGTLDLYTIGIAYTEIDLGAVTLDAPSGSSDQGFVAKYSFDTTTGGEWEWAIRYFTELVFQHEGMHFIDGNIVVLSKLGIYLSFEPTGTTGTLGTLLDETSSNIVGGSDFDPVSNKLTIAGVYTGQLSGFQIVDGEPTSTVIAGTPEGGANVYTLSFNASDIPKEGSFPEAIYDPATYHGAAPPGIDDGESGVFSLRYKNDNMAFSYDDGTSQQVYLGVPSGNESILLSKLALADIGEASVVNMDVSDTRILVSGDFTGSIQAAEQVNPLNPVETVSYSDPYVSTITGPVLDRPFTASYAIGVSYDTIQAEYYVNHGYSDASLAGVPPLPGLTYINPESPTQGIISGFKLYSYLVGETVNYSPVPAAGVFTFNSEVPGNALSTFNISANDTPTDIAPMGAFSSQEIMVAGDVLLTLSYGGADSQLGAISYGEVTVEDQTQPVEGPSLTTTGENYGTDAFWVFTTREYTPPPNPTSDRPWAVVGIPNGTGVRFYWNEPEVEETIAYYEIEFSADSEMATSLGSLTTDLEVDPLATDITVADPPAGETGAPVYFRIRAVYDDETVGPYSDIKQYKQLGILEYSQTYSTGGSTLIEDQTMVPSFEWDAENGFTGDVVIYVVGTSFATSVDFGTTVTEFIPDTFNGGGFVAKYSMSLDWEWATNVYSTPINTSFAGVHVINGEPNVFPKNIGSGIGFVFDPDDGTQNADNTFVFSGTPQGEEPPGNLLVTETQFDGTNLYMSGFFNGRLTTMELVGEDLFEADVDGPETSSVAFTLGFDSANIPATGSNYVQLAEFYPYTSGIITGLNLDTSGPYDSLPNLVGGTGFFLPGDAVGISYDDGTNNNVLAGFNDYAGSYSLLKVAETVNTNDVSLADVETTFNVDLEQSQLVVVGNFENEIDLADDADITFVDPPTSYTTYTATEPLFQTPSLPEFEEPPAGVFVWALSIGLDESSNPVVDYISHGFDDGAQARNASFNPINTAEIVLFGAKSGITPLTIDVGEEEPVLLEVIFPASATALFTLNESITGNALQPFSPFANDSPVDIAPVGVVTGGEAVASTTVLSWFTYGFLFDFRGYTTLGQRTSSIPPSGAVDGPALTTQETMGDDPFDSFEGFIGFSRRALPPPPEL